MVFAPVLDIEFSFLWLAGLVTKNQIRDYYTAIHALQKAKLKPPLLILFWHVEELTSPARALLEFALSMLSQNSSFHILMLTHRPLQITEPEGCKVLKAGPILKHSLKSILSFVLPDEPLRNSLLLKSVSSPEQILSALQNHLKSLDPAWWPAPARQTMKNCSF